jgi:uncharacterized damage-inducible protein DinB
MENRATLLEHYRESRERLMKALDGLSDAHMTERSIDGWSVKDHLSHLVLWDELRAAEVERISSGFDSAWRMTEAQVATYNGLGHELREANSLAQVLWELEHSRARLLRAIGGASERGLDGSLYGEAGLKSDHEEEHAGWIRAWRERNGY